MSESETLESILSVYCDDCISASRTDDCEKSCADIEALNKALDLLEAKEQNRIIELPVPIGSSVFFAYGRFVREEPFYGSWAIEAVMDINEEWGKRVFATREEAEKRLAELRGEE